jgi:hypothetical protein
MISYIFHLFPEKRIDIGWGVSEKRLWTNPLQWYVQKYQSGAATFDWTIS